MKSHKQQIVDLLKDGRYHPMRELNLIGYRYGARVDELNDELAGKGYEVYARKNPINRSEWQYRLQPVGWPEDQPVQRKVHTNSASLVEYDVAQLERFVEEPPRQTILDLPVQPGEGLRSYIGRFAQAANIYNPWGRDETA